ncbi:hypothetical protein DGWBC_0328 [Dehalogenimonas sp. WBC-2]|nr:hypothetical protein DGWBC_0328 [Dehalogenimonas sp. WBC-2]
MTADNDRQIEDLPPEFCHYADEGCKLAESCLNCPFPMCYHDDPALFRRQQAERRNEEMFRLRQCGKSLADIAAALGLKRGTVIRGIAQHAQGQSNY